MNEAQKRIIAKEADRLRGQIKGGLLYGFPIDMDNPDMVIVAVVLAEKEKERERIQNKFSEFISLRD